MQVMLGLLLLLKIKIVVVVVVVGNFQMNFHLSLHYLVTVILSHLNLHSLLVVANLSHLIHFH